MNEPSASPGPDVSPRGLHLDSWKEIAAYLKRDIRTVQRWEKREGLPVHRHQHDERGTAYAYSAEIDRWLDARSQRTNGDGLEATRAGAVTETTADANPPGVALPRDERPDRPAVANRTRRGLPLLLAVAAVAILGTGVAMWRWPSDEPAHPLSTLAMVFPAHERFPEWGPDLALSPDGKSLVYVPRGAFRLRRLDELEGRVMRGTEAAWGPFFSPDGREIGFFQSGKLMRMPLGGTPAAIADLNANFMGGADWGTNGRIVFGSPTPERSHGLYQVASAGGRPQLISTLEGDAELAYWLTPQWIGDGDAVLCTVVRTSPDGPRFQAVVVSVATGEQRVLIEDARHARDLGGMVVYWRNDELLAARFDSRRLELIGPHVPAWENVGSRVRNRSWSQAGDTLVYWPKVRRARNLVWVDRNGRQEPLRLPAGSYRSPRLSPDERRMAVVVEWTSSEFGDVWVHDLDKGASLQLTHGNRSVSALWTADGMHLVVSMRQGSSIDLFRVRADGGGEPEKVVSASDFPAANYNDPIGWASNGDLILQQYWIRTASKFWAVPLDEARAPRRQVLADAGAAMGSVSADGRWIAFVSGEAGRSEVYVAPLPEGRPKWRVSTEGGAFPWWARHGHELFYRNGTRMMAVPVSIDGKFVPGEPRQVLDIDVYEVDPGEPHFDVSADGTRFVIVQRGAVDAPERLNVIQGWRSEVERRLLNAR